MALTRIRGARSAAVEARQVGERRLGRAVGDEATIGHSSHRRGDVHDRTAAALEHGGRGGLRQRERGRGVEVDGALEVPDRGVEQRSGRRAADVVDDDVDPAEPLLGQLDQAGERFGVIGVDLGHRRPSPEGGDLSPRPSSSWARVRAASTTSAPASASASAQAAPMPRPPPVTIATLSSTRNSSITPIGRDHTGVTGSPHSPCHYGPAGVAHDRAADRLRQVHPSVGGGGVAPLVRRRAAGALQADGGPWTSTRFELAQRPQPGMPGLGFTHVTVHELDADDPVAQSTATIERLRRVRRHPAHATVGADAVVAHGPWSDKPAPGDELRGHILANVMCTDPAREAEWDEWYDEVHVPDMLSCGAFGAMTRWRRIPRPEVGPAHVTLYDVATETVARGGRSVRRHARRPDGAGPQARRAHRRPHAAAGAPRARSYTAAMTDVEDHAEPVEVGFFSSIGEAEVAQAKLRAFGIESALSDEVEGGTLATEGEIGVSLLVRHTDAEAAKEVLTEVEELPAEPDPAE